jgi:hypothetical protein
MRVVDLFLSRSLFACSLLCHVLSLLLRLLTVQLSLSGDIHAYTCNPYIAFWQMACIVESRSL